MGEKKVGALNSIPIITTDCVTSNLPSPANVTMCWENSSGISSYLHLQIPPSLCHLLPGVSKPPPAILLHSGALTPAWGTLASVSDSPLAASEFDKMQTCFTLHTPPQSPSESPTAAPRLSSRWSRGCKMWPCPHHTLTMLGLSVLQPGSSLPLTVLYSMPQGLCTCTSVLSALPKLTPGQSLLRSCPAGPRGRPRHFLGHPEDPLAPPCEWGWPRILLRAPQPWQNQSWAVRAHTT